MYVDQDVPAGWHGMRPLGVGITGLHDLVAQQAVRTPSAVAVIEGGLRVTYGEVNRRANQVADLLRDHGARPESVVGVYLERGVDLVVALLAVWKAGAVQLPLNPAFPHARIVSMVKDSGAALVLTHSALTERVWGPKTLCLDSLSAELDLRSDDEVDSGVQLANAAYVVYTSGSTGRPKGVVISHAGITNRVLWTVRQHGLSADDRVLHKTAISFDAACWEVFAALVAGGAVVEAPTGAEQSPAALVRAIAEHDITVFQTVPSMLRLLVDDLGWQECASLRLLFSAGEQLHAELCQRLLAKVDVEVWNTYGPTECSIDVTAACFDPAQASGPVPIGMPINGIRAYIVDASGELVDDGEPGELYVGGVGIARGYLGLPAMTAQRFVPDRWGEPGERVYRTGDIVQYTSHGGLVYLWRVDQLVKVDGVRVEPGEVEAVVLAFPNIVAAAVISYATQTGNTRLAAYVISESDFQHDELRSFLLDRLPGPFVPSTFVRLTEFPLTPNGKLDRSALPVPDVAVSGARATYVAPRTSAERAVAQAWSELLRVDRVGAHDNFFELGGSSMLLAKVTGSLLGASADPAVLREMLSLSTVEEQAQLIAGRKDRVTPDASPHFDQRSH